MNNQRQEENHTRQKARATVANETLQAVHLLTEAAVLDGKVKVVLTSEMLPIFTLH